MDVALGKAVDHRLLEAALVVEHVVWNANPLRDRARIIDILARAAGTFAMVRSTMESEFNRPCPYRLQFAASQRNGMNSLSARLLS